MVRTTCWKNIHPRCRSTISAITEGGKRIAKVNGKNIKVPAEMKYKDFKAVYLEKRMTLEDWRGGLKSGRIKPDKPVVYPFGHKVNEKIYGGVKCTVSSAKAKFLNGTIERDCIVYMAADGVRFFFPKDLDIDKQTMTPKKGKKKIVFLDIYNPQDEFWARIYKDFKHSYATGGAEIIFYRYEKEHSVEYLKHTYCHETAHFIDDKQGCSSSEGWLSAMKSDKDFVSEYAQNSPTEDFAESLAAYIEDEVAFTAKFPKRAQFLKKIFE